MTKQEVIDVVIPILKKYPVKQASFFGSYAREDYTPKSDIDIIVDFYIEKVGLLFFSLREDLTEALPVYLDLVYKPGLKCMDAEFQENIRKEEDVFYEADFKSNI